MTPDRRATLFTLMNEIGILNQLATAELARHLPDGLHPSHFAVLLHLTNRGDGRTPMAIASAMQVTRATMTHTLATLAARGLVAVQPNPKDGRSKQVFLLPAGHAFRDAAIAALAPMMDAIDAALDADRLAGLLPELRRLRQWMDAARD